jgi:hypothetical protein
VEVAFAIPVLVAVTVLLVWVMSLGATYVRALDAAQTAARQAARGAEVPGESDGIRVSIDRANDIITAEASTDVAPPLLAFSGWSLTIRAEAHAAPEWLAP